METVPVILDGEKRGELKIVERGLVTVYEAEADYRGDGIIRLSVYGGGKEGRLGVLVPEGGRLRLRKSFSAASAAEFPPRAEYAARSGELLREYRDEPVKAPPPSADEVLLWFSTPDGVLTAFDGRRSLIAVPADGITVPEGLRRKIDGREYVVFTGTGRRK